MGVVLSSCLLLHYLWLKCILVVFNRKWTAELSPDILSWQKHCVAMFFSLSLDVVYPSKLCCNRQLAHKILKIFRRVPHMYFFITSMRCVVDVKKWWRSYRLPICLYVLKILGVEPNNASKFLLMHMPTHDCDNTHVPKIRGALKCSVENEVCLSALTPLTAMCAC